MVKPFLQPRTPSIFLSTPDPGINFDSSSIIKSASVGRNGTSNTSIAPSSPSLGWFRTMIEIERTIVHPWPLDSQDWSTVSLGSLDVSLRAVTCSPSHLDGPPGCIVATINSNMELTLWRAAKNYLRGQWVKLLDLTAALKLAIASRRDESNTIGASSLENTIRAQIQSIAWSPQADFGIAPTPNLDGSLLVLGSRSGCVYFLRRLEQAQDSPHAQDFHSGVSLVQSVQVGEKWITHLAWAPWTVMDLGHCESILACGAADGSIVLVKVRQALSPIQTTANFGQEYRIETAFEVLQQNPARPDRMLITALTWIDLGESVPPVLVFSKPGTICLHSQAPPAESCSGSTLLRLRTQELSTGSSYLASVSGVTYARKQDALIVSLSDGSFHIVHNIKGISEDRCTLDAPAAGLITSEQVSKAARAAFVQVEPKEIKNSDVGWMGGMTTYDGSSTVIWAHEGRRPSDFSYKAEAKHTSMLVVAQLWDDTSDETILEDMAVAVSTAKSATGLAPLHILRAIYLRLSEPTKVPRLYRQILAILQPQFPDESTSVFIPTWSNTLDPQVRREFRRNIVRHLYGWDPLLSLRLRLALADFCWKMSSDPQSQAECGHVAQSLLNAISHRIQRIILRHLSSVTSALTPQDVPFAMRIVLQSLLPGSPSDLTAEAQALAARISNPETGTHAFEEACPACGADVPLQELTNAVCARGHVWARCSITSFILSTPLVRTCVGCSRKAFLPLSQAALEENSSHLPASAQSWVVEELLEAVQRCLFCGNAFVNII